MRHIQLWSRGAVVVSGVFLALTSLALALPAAAQDMPFQPDQVSEQPKISDPVQARTAISRSYAPALQDAGVEGRVEVAFIVNADGAVDPTSIRVLNTPPQALVKAAEAAVARIKFVPAVKDGSKVRCHAALAVVYQRGM